GGARSVGRLRQLVEPGMQITQRIAIAALALLDPLDEPAEQALDGPLVHGTIVGRLAISVTAAGLPSSFRSHPNPHECDAAENSRGRSGVGLKNSRDTRRSGRNSRWQGGVNFALSGGLLWDKRVCHDAAERAAER